jgi:hypothetical protein
MAHYPTETELVVAVRPAFLTAIKTASAEAGQPCTPDGTLDVPGLAVSVGQPFIAARPAPAAAADLWAAMLRGDDESIALPALTVGEVAW